MATSIHYRHRRTGNQVTYAAPNQQLEQSDQWERIPRRGRPTVEQPATKPEGQDPPATTTET